jgi:hypothetical protein
MKMKAHSNIECGSAIRSIEMLSRGRDVGAISVTLKKLTGRSSMHWGYLLITRVNIGV